VLAAVPSHVLKVGVFVNPTPAEVEARIAALGLDRAQLHGDERSDTFAAMDGERIIRVIRVQDGSSFAAATSWKSALFLYDAFVEGYGGAGVPPPWPLVARLARRPFLLAGGLTPRNVELAIATVRPNGVDVASGVERFTRQKDPQLLAAFIAAARSAARKL
jgi:phosphoribosylanthranilate isomerase